MGPPSEQCANLLVSDLMLEGSTQWDRSKIQRLLPEYEVKILSLKPSITGSPDKLVWMRTTSGDYSVKSGYFTALEEEPGMIPTDTSFSWKKHVWNLDCAPKIKHFAWKILKRALPVGERLVQRHINADPTCKRCGEIESINHLFFQCRFAQRVWLLAPFISAKDYRGIIDLIPIWPSLCNQTCLPPAGVSSPSLFIWILWSLWKARNRFVFDGFSASPEDTLSTAIVLAREWGCNSKTEPGTPARHGSHQLPPAPGTLVVQSDAAWCATSSTAGLGWISLSSPPQEYQERTEFVGSPLLAESLALREAVITARRSERRIVCFQSDSKQLMMCVNSGSGAAEIHTIASDILSLSVVFEDVSFIWIPRDKNLVADRLAKNALLVSETVVVGDAVNAP